jgi:phage-related protein
MTIKRRYVMKKKKLIWMGSSYEDLVLFPPEVVHAFGYALFRAELGESHEHAKVFSGMGNAKVWEIRENDRSGTYRVVYTIEMQNFVFVLHAFQKKSKSGISTPKQEIELLNKRLSDARELYKQLKGRTS